MRFALLVTASLLLAAPVFADVKAGVDAWQRGDYRKAVEEWRPLAVAGDADAQFNLGQAYKLGRGVPVDPQMAESWFGKAARQGHEQAEDNYALALFQGGRRPEALPWLAKATARDEPRTELVLGTMLFNGDGVPRDYVRAYALMTRAAAPRPAKEGVPPSNGLASARETLAQMDSYISPTDRERGVAMAQQIALTAQARPAVAPGRMRVTDQPPGPLPMATPTPAVRTAAVPPARVPRPVPTPRAARPTPAPSPTPAARPRPAPSPTPAARPRPAASPTPTAKPRPVPTPAPAAAPAVRGGWKVQLGAFRSRANADALWARVKGKMGGAQASYVATGPVTRLIATGYANKADAQAACARAGGGCIVVAP